MSDTQSVEKYEIIQVERRVLTNAPYIPRKMKDTAKEKLKEYLKNVGLLSPIIWNKRTGHIVGGHRRIEAMDAIYETQEYKLNVAAVDLDEKTEKEQNLFLNNKLVQGEFDMDKLAEMWEDQIDFSQAGFDSIDLQEMFGVEGDVLAEQMQEEQLEEEAKKYEKGIDHRKKREASAFKNNDLGYYAVLVFPERSDRDSFLIKHDLPPGDAFIHGERFDQAIRESQNVSG